MRAPAGGRQWCQAAPLHRRRGAYLIASVLKDVFKMMHGYELDLISNIVWRPHNMGKCIDKLERVQRRATRLKS